MPNFLLVEVLVESVLSAVDGLESGLETVVVGTVVTGVTLVDWVIDEVTLVDEIVGGLTDVVIWICCGVTNDLETDVVTDVCVLA